MYVSEICAEGIFVTFPWWVQTVKSRSKIALFQISAILKFDVQRKKTIRFFWSKVSKLHKKDPILPVTTTFALKQGKQEQRVDPFHIRLGKVEGLKSGGKITLAGGSNNPQLDKG